MTVATPVIFTTGYEGSVGNHAFVVAERVPLLRKPYSAADLLGLVQRTLLPAKQT